MIHSVTPSGVEHPADLSKHANEGNVIQSVTPSGVEHTARVRHSDCWPIVIQSVTPSGVEHHTTASIWEPLPRDPISDAFGR